VAGGLEERTFGEFCAYDTYEQCSSIWATLDMALILLEHAITRRSVSALPEYSFLGLQLFA